MGSKSKAKGSRAERELVGILRRAGYKAERVVGSGAHGNRTGHDVLQSDVLVWFEGREKPLKIECKVRAKDFDILYPLSDQFQGSGFILSNEAAVEVDTLAYMLDTGAIRDCGNGEPALDIYTEPSPKLDKKLISMQAWVKGADILAVRQDRKPWLIIRYL